MHDERKPWAELSTVTIVAIAAIVTTQLVSAGHMAVNGFGATMTIGARTGRQLALLGAWVTIPVLLVAAATDLTRRLHGVEATLAKVVMVAAIIQCLSVPIEVYATYVDRWSNRNLMLFYRWQPRLEMLAWLTWAGALAAIAARRGHAGLVAGGALVVTVFLAFPLASVSEFIAAHGRGKSARAWNVTIFAILRLSFAASFAWVSAYVAAGRPAAPPSTTFQVRGLHQTGSALIGRVLVAVVSAGLMVMALAGKSPGLMKIVVTVVPVALLGLAVMQLVGMFRIARGEVARVRFLIAATATLWVTTVQAIQAIATFRVARASWGDSAERDDFRFSELTDMMGALPYLKPALWIAAMMTLLSGIKALRTARHIPDDGTTASATIGFVMASATAAALEHGVFRPTTLGEAVLLALVVAAANVVALVSIARACHKTAWSLQLDPEVGLPSARVANDERTTLGL